MASKLDKEIAHIVALITHPAAYIVSVFVMLDVRQIDGWFEVCQSCGPYAPKVMLFRDPKKAARRFITWCTRIELNADIEAKLFRKNDGSAGHW